ncbi:MAG: tetratricopeptide repeat protein [Candidatus Thorarchaeota archaeon]
MRLASDYKDKQAEAARWYDFAYRKFIDGDYRAAHEALEVAVELSPEEPEYHHRLAYIKERLGDDKGAKAEYRKTLEIDASIARAWSSLALLHAKMDEYEEALQAADRAEECDSQDPEVLMTKGILFSDVGIWDKAEHLLLKAVSLAPDNPETWLNLAIFLDRADRSEEAIPKVERAIELDPTSAVLHNLLGMILYNAGHYDSSKQALIHAIELDADEASAHFHLAKTLYELDELERCEEALREAIRLRHEEAKYHYGLGDILYSIGRFKEAEESLTEACRLDSEYEDAANLLDQVSIRLAGGNDPKRSVFVHDRGEELTRLIAYASHLQDCLWKEIPSIESLQFGLKTIGGAHDQTHYVVTGLTLRIQGSDAKTIRKVSNSVIQEWDNPTSIQLREGIVEIEIGVLNGGDCK